MAEFTKESGRQLMRVMDEQTKEVLSAMGYDASRWDVRVCPEEGWMVVKIRIRPLPAKA